MISYLERKQYWSDKDVLAFAQLHRQDSQLEQRVTGHRLAVKNAESAVDQAQAHFMESMRERYQAEQLWSEKMRVLGTIGTCIVLFGQAVLLWLSQAIIEPARREAMVSRIMAETEKTLLGISSNPNNVASNASNASSAVSAVSASNAVNASNASNASNSASATVATIASSATDDTLIPEIPNDIDYNAFTKVKVLLSDFWDKQWQGVLAGTFMSPILLRFIGFIVRKALLLW